ncbi:clathrin heavy chain linker domain-containing protein 1-like isoform X4 [Chiloscyllium plagiosum]|uniref:clathrin heavy chain linker domain-containing protein 1-like isoform X4 n=1 Tax=Chiloscyllium plagiosum TaxID=36176 RepID=UPI001CB7BB8D|nr:clathrin heavy chain linker domain-containing protein 1-like isoform X4 [Chiloscyllium plagiosum]
MAAEGLSTATPGKSQAHSPNPANRNLCRIRTHINTETEALGCPDQGPDEQRYIIYRNVFDKVIENATAYKNILTSIKQEYEESINVLHKGKEDSLFLRRKLKSMAFEPMTYVAYKKRAIQLQNKIDLIKQNTAELEAHLQAVKKSRDVQKEQTKQTLPPQEDVFHITCIPGLTLQESINVEDLCKHLRNLEKKLKSLEFAKETKYVPIQIKTNIIQDINQKMQQWEVLDMVNKQLKLRFNKLFDDKQYRAAAKHVANCPRGILHNLEVMERFKAITEYEGHISPLLQFFEAVMNSFSAVKQSPNAKMSLEGVECALTQNRLDLVIHWIIQQRVTCSEELGDLIYNYGDTELRNMDTCMVLAQIVYNKCDVHKKAALCLCRCRQISGAMEYIRDSKKFSLDDYLFLMNKCPNSELIQCLTNEWNGNPAVLSTGIAVLWLISNDHEETGFHLLKEIYDSGQDAMERTILNDVNCTLEDWQEIAAKCITYNCNELADSIFTVLTSQEGGTVIRITTESDNDGAKLIEHIFL